MIAVDGCAVCRQACQETHPIGWSLVRVYIATRAPDEPGSQGTSRHVMNTNTRPPFLICNNCFPKWWSGQS